jgi:mannose-6-phosphate isomerase
VKPEPFRIEPTFVPRIWGARSLAPLYPEKSNLPEPIGEAWLTGVDCKVASGPFAGKTLGEAWREMPPEWRGTRFTEPGDFPILIKFIFPNEKLSIQVHPDDAYAAAHEQAAGGRGKTEMWHVLSAKSGASLLLGLKPGVTRESFVKALENHTLEDLFQRHSVQTGDTYFVPARTPHTIGPDMVICEVQEYSDITYRVYDYGRIDAKGKPRELHIEKALDVIDFNTQATQPIRWDVPMGEIGSGYLYYLAACRYFAVEKWVFDGWANENTDEKCFELITVLKGNGDIRWDDRECSYAAGETWLVPASLAKYMFCTTMGGSETVRIYMPEIAAFERMIAAKGYPEAMRRRFIFP